MIGKIFRPNMEVFGYNYLINEMCINSKTFKTRTRTWQKTQCVFITNINYLGKQRMFILEIIWKILRRNVPSSLVNAVLHVQCGAEPTDTYQMVIDNIWKQEKISETVYKYVQVCYLLPTYYKLIFWKLYQADGLRLYQYIVVNMSGSYRTRTSVGPHQ